MRTTAKFQIIFQSLRLKMLSLIISLSFLHALLAVLTIFLISNLLSTSHVLNETWSRYLPESFASYLSDFSVFIIVCSILLMVVTGLIKNNLIFQLIAYARHVLSMKVLDTFMVAPEAVVGKNQGDMKTLVLEETQQIVKQLLSPMIEIASSSLFILVITLFLLLTNPLLTMVSVLAVALHFVFAYLLTAEKIQRYGRSRFENNQARYSKIDDFFNLFKLTFVMRPGRIFISRFSRSSEAMAKAQYLFDATAHAPRVILDGVIFSIVLLVYTAQQSSSLINIDASIYDLSILVMGALKIAPEAQKVYHALGLLKFGSATQRELTQLLSTTPLPEFYVSNGSSKSISLQFDECCRGDTVLFCDVDLDLNGGDRIAILGRSGAGKTSLIECIMGILPVRIAGETKRLKVDVRFGYLPQETFLFTGSVIDNIRMGVAEPLSDNYLKEYAEQLFPEIQDIKTFLNREVTDISSTLSVGQKQRIGLLRAVFSRPEVVILDEFTSALDAKSERLVVDFIETNLSSAIVMIIGHRTNSMLNCNRAIKIENGSIRSASLMDSSGS